MRSEKDTTPYNRVYDDIDSIVAAKTERAVRIREVSVDGLVRMLSHDARLEEPAYLDFVVDPELVTKIAEQGLADAALETLRAGIATAKKGGAARMRYAIVRLAGAECPEAAEGLRGKPPHRDAVLAALAALASSPPSIAPLLERLMKKAFGITDPRTSAALLQVILRMPPDASGALLLRALEDDELRRATLAAIRGGGVAAIAPSDVLVKRFVALAAEIEASRTSGFPSRSALAILPGIASLVTPDLRLARLALGIFDLTPGVIPKPAEWSKARETVIAERLEPLCRLLHACVAQLDDTECARLASFMTSSVTERFPPAAAAWARLPLDRASALAASWAKDGPALEDARWMAAVRALAELSAPRADLVALAPARIAKLAAR